MGTYTLEEMIEKSKSGISLRSVMFFALRNLFFRIKIIVTFIKNTF